MIVKEIRNPLKEYPTKKVESPQINMTTEYDIKPKMNSSKTST